MKSTHEKSVMMRFSASAGTYQSLAVIQNLVLGKICELFKRGDGRKEHILEIGCGTGLLTRKIRNYFPNASIDAIDISPGMIMEARKQFPHDNRIQWITSDLMDLPGTTTYSLIVSSSSLHWIQPIGAALSRLSGLLAKDGELIVALMVRGTLKELRDARQHVAPNKPPYAQLPSTSEVRYAIYLAGLRILNFSAGTQHIDYPSTDIFLQQLHNQGLTGGYFSRSKVALTARELRQLVTYCNSCYKSNHGIYASYRTVYVRAKKANDL